ncbi:MAG: hypothetical protein ACLSAP_12970, partial [Oscillospiraceae bacterium]
WRIQAGFSGKNTIKQWETNCYIGTCRKTDQKSFGMQLLFLPGWSAGSLLGQQSGGGQDQW